MVYGCGNNFVKFVVFITNLLLFIFGGLICGFSLWANLDKNFALHLSEFARQVKISDEFVDDLAKYQASLWVLVAVGALLFVVGFLGCCGAACESMLLLALQFIVILILAVIQIFAIGYLLTNRADLLFGLKNFMEKSAQTPEGRMNLLPIQKMLHCCGATEDTMQKYKDEGRCEGDLQFAHDCYSAISAKLEDAGETIVAIGIICLIVEFVSLVFNCVLFRAFRDRENPYVVTY
uniref:Tetraspanin n=1 Tax=Panagrolaimus sp. JU765 TaxID=591449 RepID=A0AC34PW04_9BILA